ncbi:MAG: FtsX-like permease family protein, partial [Rikenellaceae bacterium]
MKTLTIAVRTLKNYKLYNIINILGLALSLACTIVLSRYIYREFTVDGFNKDIDRVYAEVVEYRGDKARMSHFGNMNNEAGFINLTDHPSVEAITIYTPLPDDCIEYNNRKYFNITFAVDSMFLPITARHLALGNCKTALCNPGDAVITALFAKKIFGDENPMGKTVIHSTGKVFTIVGVLAEDVVKPFMNYDLLIASAKDDWSRIPHGLVKLHKGTNVDDINKAHEKYQKFRSTANREVRSQFVSYKSLYYDETLDWSYNPIYNKGDLNSMLLLIIVAIVVFVVGLFNFVNIYTVMLLKRGKEFGLKKVFGVNAAAMLKQLITENIMLVMLSVALGWVLIFASKEFLELQLNIPQMSNKKFDLMVTLSLIFIVPFITSLYPYFKYKNEVSVVSMQKMANSRSTSRIRSVLLVAQYVVSITMIIFSIYFVKQLRFMLNADLGFNTEGVVETKFVSENFSLQSSNQWRQKILEQSKLLEARFDALPIIKGWYFGSTIDDGAGSVKLKRLGGEYKEVQLSYIDKGFELVYDIHAIAGRMPIDSIDRREDKNYNIWINESAAKLFNI